MNKRDVVAAIGIILFILGACGCDGQPVVCGIVSLIGLMIVYACQKREEYEKKKRDFETKKQHSLTLTSSGAILTKDDTKVSVCILTQMEIDAKRMMDAKDGIDWSKI